MRNSTPLLLSLAVLTATSACTKPVQPAKSSELAQKLGTNKEAITTGFAAGSLVIPMDVLQDVTANSHAIKAYGLVTELALNGVTINWAISGTKAIDGADITGFAGKDITSGTTYASQSLYGGPFVVDASDAAAAMTVITAWNTPTQQAVVLEATSSFTANIQEQIVAAPRIAIDDDGYEYFAFNYLNGAGITDSQGNAWPTAQSSNPPYTSPDTLEPSQIGAGSLLNSDGTPAFTNLTSMHYNGTIADSTVLGVQTWLKSTPLTMAVMECAAITAFENNTNGYFLTTAGFTASSTAPASGTVILPDAPLNQLYITGGTTLSTTSGLEAEMNLASGSAWQSGVQILAAGTAPATNVLWVSGPAYGNTSYGTVTYLAGHDYDNGSSTPPLPISTHNLTNGVRMYLNAFLQTAAIQAQYQPVVTTSMTSTFPNAGGVVTYTINYAVGGSYGIASSATLTDVLPTGMSYTSCTATAPATCANSSGTVTFTLGNLTSGSSGTVTVTGTATSGSTFSNYATLGWKIGRTPKSVVTNTVQNVFPVTTITSGPANPTAATSATFTFVSSVSGATFMCKLDTGSYAACTSPATYTGLSVASHTLTVESVVSGGNTELVPPTYTWVVEAAPVVTIVPGAGASTYSNSTSATFTFTPTKPIASYTCSLNGGAFATCTTPKTFTGLSNGTQTLLVNATDTTGLATLTPASYSWTVNTTAPTVTIATGPASLTNATTASFTYTSTETPVTYLCKLSPATTFTSSSSCTNATFTGLTAGAHTLQIEATDEYGNTSAASNTWSWTIETTPPTISITAHPSVLSNSSAANFTLVGAATAPAAVSSYICSLDGAAYAACSSTPSYTGLSNATHTFLANVIDTAGNEATAPASFTWTVNTTAPTATITAGPANPTNATTADFTFSATESPVSYLCKLSPATTYTSCPDPQTYSGLSNGNYTLTIEAVDEFGNTSAPSAPWSWTVDTTAPTVSIPTGPALLTNQTSASFTIVAVDSEPISTYLCSLDGAAFTACSAAPSYAGPLSAGQHILQANVIDAAGNTAVTPATYTWTIGTQAPTVTILTGPSTPTDMTTAVFTFSSTESPTTYQCKLSPATTYSACPANDTYTGLTNGTYTLSVIGTDKYGNTSTPATWTWTVDNTAPVVTITSGPALNTNATTATFVISAVDTLPISTYLCSLDGAAYTDCTSTQTYNSLANGTHTFLANAQDTAGNIATAPASYTWTINTNPPSITIVSGPQSPTNSTTATFVYSSNESPVTYLCELSPATTYTTCPTNFPNLTNGTYTLNVEAMDQYGNTSTTPATWTWTVDTTLPLIQITSGPALLTNQTTAAFVVVASDTLSITSYLCSLDGGAYTVCSTTPSYSSLADGTHVFHVTAIDAAGNQAAPPASYTWTIDTQTPTFTITGQPSNPTDQTTATFTFSSPETLTYECELAPATTFTPCPVTFTNLSPGTQTVTIEGVDPYGNVTAPQTVTWNIDTTLPAVTITSGPAQQTNSSNAAFVVVAMDSVAIVSYECSLDGAAFSVCSSTPSYTSLPDGMHVFEATAIDAAGNVGAPPAVWTWTIDTQTPTFTIVSGPPTQTSSTTATFTFSSPVPGVTYLCELAPATTYTPCPPDFTNLPNGPQTLMVEAQDPYGNVSPPQTYTWTVDTTPPTVQILTGPALFSNSSTANFTLFAMDTVSISTYLCGLDGAAFQPCTSTPTFTGLSNGQHTLLASATDVLGNTAVTPASYTWAINTQPPTTTIVNGPPTNTNETTATFIFSSDESPVTYLCELSPATTFTPCPVPPVFTGLSDGPYTLTVEAEDQYGNVDPNPPSYSWTVTTTPPIVTITSGPPLLSNMSTANFTLTSSVVVNFLCSLDGAAFTSCTSTPSYTMLKDGSHTLLAGGTDAAGNTANPPASYTWTIDTVPPTTQIVTKPPLITNSTTGSFTFSSSANPASYLCELSPATTFTPCPIPAVFTGLTNGTYTLTVASEDEYGNVDPNPPSYTWTVNTTSPVVTITSGPASMSTATTADFVLASTETLTTYLCALDGATYTMCSSTPSYTGLAVGAHTFTASGLDAAGNMAVPATYTWTVLPALPNTTILTMPSNPSNESTAVFVFGSNASPVTFQCELDTATSFTACPVPAIFPDLPDGSHTLTVRAMDSFGQVDPNPPSYTWVIDTTPPVATIVTHPPAITNSTTANFTFSANKSPVTYQCQLDNSGSFTACATPDTFTVTNGQHVLQVRAVDSSGLVSPIPAVASWIVNTLAPTTIILTGPATTTTATTATFTFTANEDPVTYECSVDSTSEWAACTSPTTLSSVSVGAHAFHVRAKDDAGNVDPNPPSYPWTVEAPPVAPTPESLQFRGARLGCASSTTGMWALLGLLPLLGARRRRLARVRAR